VFLPDFKNSIVNVSASMSRYLGNNPNHCGIKILDEALSKNPQNVVFFVIDALGVDVIERILPVDSVLRKNIVAKVTSVFPSTTPTGTTSLQSAMTPGEHGWLGWSLQHDDNIIEIFKGTDYYTRELVYPDFPTKQMAYDFIWKKHNPDIETHSFRQPGMKFKVVADNDHKFSNTHELQVGLQKILVTPAKKFVYVYMDYIDQLIHDFGVFHKKVRRCAKKLNAMFEHFLAKTKDTLFVITADHGAIDIADYVPIYKDTALMKCLSAPPSMDVRATVFHVKPGMDSEFKTAFNAYKADFDLYTTNELIKRGVFGPTVHEKWRNKLGDFIAVGNESNKCFQFKKGQAILAGHHTGLTKGEMLVPLVLLRCK